MTSSPFTAEATGVITITRSDTRLRPLTYSRPKCLLPIANVAIVSHALNLFDRNGIDSVIIVSSIGLQLFDPVVEEATERGMAVQVVHAEQTGLPGALRKAARSAPGRTLVHLHEDVFTDADLGAILRSHRAAEAAITTVSPEIPRSHGAASGDRALYVIEPSVVQSAARGTVQSLRHEVIPRLQEEGRGVHEIATRAYWTEISDCASYLQANLDVLLRACSSDAAVDGRDGSSVSEDAAVSQDASVYLSSIAAGSVVGSGATVDRSVLLPGSVVSPGARVRGSVVGVGAWIGAGAQVTSGWIADGAIVAVGHTTPAA